MGGGWNTSVSSHSNTGDLESEGSHICCQLWVPGEGPLSLSLHLGKFCKLFLLDNINFWQSDISATTTFIKPSNFLEIISFKSKIEY